MKVTTANIEVHHVNGNHPLQSLGAYHCKHPVSHEIMLHEDIEAPRRITGIKCSQCGQYFPYIVTLLNDRR